MLTKPGSEEPFCYMVSFLIPENRTRGPEGGDVVTQDPDDDMGGVCDSGKQSTIIDNI